MDADEQKVDSCNETVELYFGKIIPVESLTSLELIWRDLT